jgi:hypothetical protein
MPVMLLQGVKEFSAVSTAVLACGVRVGCIVIVKEGVFCVGCNYFDVAFRGLLTAIWIHLVHLQIQKRKSTNSILLEGLRMCEWHNTTTSNNQAVYRSITKTHF